MSKWVEDWEDLNGFAAIGAEGVGARLSRPTRLADGAAAIGRCFRRSRRR